MSDHKAILASVHLFVKDMTNSVAFYRKIGLSIPDHSIWSVQGKGHHAEIPMPNGLVLELDSVELTKGYDEQWQDPVGPSRNLIMFSLPSRPAVDTLHDELTAMGYGSHLVPMDAFWGARYAVVYDPDGNLVGLMSPRSSDRQRQPPPL